MLGSIKLYFRQLIVKSFHHTRTFRDHILRKQGYLPSVVMCTLSIFLGFLHPLVLLLYVSYHSLDITSTYIVACCVSVGLIFSA